MSPVPPSRGPPSTGPNTYSSAETATSEDSEPIPFGDGVPDPGRTGNSGGVPSKDSTRLFSMYAQVRSDLTLHGWGLIALAVAVGGIAAIEVLRIGAEIGWWLAGR